MNANRYFLPLFLAALLPLPALAQPASGVGTLATTTVEVRDVELTYPAEAMVEAVRQSTIAAQVTGRVIEARFDAGARFKAGEVLMRLDSREAQQGLAGAQAQLSQAKAQLERTRSLFAQKFISQAALDKAEADYKMAAAGAGQAGVASSHGNILAPFAGIVAQRLAEPGEMATPGKPLLTIFDPQSLRVVANIPQYKLAELKQGLRARIEFPATGKWLDAARVEVLPTADPLTHAVRVRLYLPGNAENDHGVIPGVFARAHFVTGQGKKLLAPASAVLRRSELTGIYVIDDKGQPRLRQVRIGETIADGVVEVLAGLRAGEKIALDPIKAGFAASQRQ